MDVQATWEELQTLPALIYKINKRDPQAISLLDKLSRRLFGETVIAGCTNCHIKAFKKLSALNYNHLIAMSETKFKLKKDTTLEYPIRSGSFYSSNTLTDEMAVSLLSEYPGMISSFEDYPKDHNGELKLYDTPVSKQADIDEDDDEEVKPKKQAKQK